MKKTISLEKIPTQKLRNGKVWIPDMMEMEGTKIVPINGFPYFDAEKDKMQITAHLSKRDDWGKIIEKATRGVLYKIKIEY